MRTLVILLLLATALTAPAAQATHACADWVTCFHPWDSPKSIVQEIRDWPGEVCETLCG